MEKVKVTEELANLIENTKKRMASHEIVANYNNIANDWKRLIDLDTLIKALYIGYEVEPEFKVGDWVVRKRYSEVVKVERIDNHGKDVWAYWRKENTALTWLRASDVRHATPEEIQQEKERRKWVDIGREVNEWKEGDIIERADGELMEITRIETTTSNVKFAFVDHVQTTFKNLNEHFSLICPAEKRFDLHA